MEVHTHTSEMQQMSEPIQDPSLKKSQKIQELREHLQSTDRLESFDFSELKSCCEAIISTQDYVEKCDRSDFALCYLDDIRLRIQ